MRFSLSFFLTTPAKKPRTECACQPVASMMVVIVVPLAWRSRDSTVSCFDGAPRLGRAETDCPDGFGVGDFDFLAGLAARLALRRFAKRSVFLELSLLAAI